MSDNILYYNFNDRVECFTAGQDAPLPYPVAQPHQVHKDVVVYVQRPGMTRADLEGVDALITNLVDVPISVRTADCIPVFLYDPVHHAIAAVHSGWRGTVLNIVAKTIFAMQDTFGTSPSDVSALIGPGIGFDSFQVGKEVMVEFENAGFPMSDISDYRGVPISGSMRGGFHINLKECVRYSLLQCGVVSENVVVNDSDTYIDNRFYSARRDGSSCGRNINSIKLL